MIEDKKGKWQKHTERQIKRPLSDDETFAIFEVWARYDPMDRRKLNRKLRIAMARARRAEISN